MVYLFFLGLLATLIFALIEWIVKDRRKKVACRNIIHYFNVPLFALLFLIVVGNNINIHLNSARYDSYLKCNYMKSYEIEDAYSYLKVVSNSGNENTDLTKDEMYNAILTTSVEADDTYITYKIQKIRSWEAKSKEFEAGFYNYSLISKLIWGVIN